MAVKVKKGSVVWNQLGNEKGGRISWYHLWQFPCCSSELVTLEIITINVKS